VDAASGASLLKSVHHNMLKWNSFLSHALDFHPGTALAPENS
jgi:hypothetical protein